MFEYYKYNSIELFETRQQALDFYKDRLERSNDDQEKLQLQHCLDDLNGITSGFACEFCVYTRIIDESIDNYKKVIFLKYDKDRHCLNKVDKSFKVGDHVKVFLDFFNNRRNQTVTGVITSLSCTFTARIKLDDCYNGEMINAHYGDVEKI